MSESAATEQMSDCDDVAIENVVINNYRSLLPVEYKKLYAKYTSTAVPCTICKLNIEENQLLIGSGKTLSFHLFCLFFEHKFDGKASEIVGFSEISAEDREILRTNVPAAGSDAAEEEDDEYLYEDDDDFESAEHSENEVEPPPKKSGSTEFYIKPITIPPKEKTPQRLAYEEFLRSIHPEAQSNPERFWGQKEDASNKPAVVKRGTVVEKEFPLAAVCYVMKTEKEDLFSITLCLTDCIVNKNCYFKMQLLAEDTQPVYHLFRTWGRIGTKRGSNFDELFTDYKEAVAEFERDFDTLTGNKWRERHFFNPKPGFMMLVEMDYTEFETLICGDDGKLIPAGTKSALHPQIKSILLKIFDAKNIKKVLDGYNFDTERMPMGKLSAMQVSRASGLLKLAEDVISKKGPGTDGYNRDSYDKEIADISNRFYSTLPQSFGHCSPILLCKQGQIDKMRGMIDALLDIIFVCNIMAETHKESIKSGIDPIDLQYNKLLTHMEVISPEHEDFKLIKQYIDNGIGATHGYKGFQLLDLIKLERYGEAAKFRRDYGNRKLLWHGSPIQNFPGILTQGLRIAPPDALLTGHAFGRGVYFADMISKSANYCRADNEQVGYLLLCDVALGNMKEMTYGSSTGLSEEQFQSVKGVGETYPDPAGDHEHRDGYKIPLGRCVRASNGNRSGGFLYYNEFIVYDTDQICCRFLCRVKFDHYR